MNFLMRSNKYTMNEQCNKIEKRSGQLKFVLVSSWYTCKSVGGYVSIRTSCSSRLKLRKLLKPIAVC